MILVFDGLFLFPILLVLVGEGTYDVEKIHTKYIFLFRSTPR